MVRMKMRVDDAIERACAECVTHERKRLRRVRRVTGIDERRMTVVDQQHVVRRQPAAFEYAHRCGQRNHGVPPFCAGVSADADAGCGITSTVALASITVSSRWFTASPSSRTRSPARLGFQNAL